MSEQQAAEMTNDSAEPESEENDAQDLDQLLSSYDSEVQEDTQTASSPKGEEDKTDSKIDEMYKYIRDQQTKEVKAQTEQDLTTAVDTLAEGLKESEVTVPKTLLKGLLHAKADEDPRFLQAWQQRHTNKTGWSNVLKALQKEVVKEMSSQPDQKMTEDRESVAAAVRGSGKSSSNQISEKKVKGMTLNQLYEQFPDLAE